MTFIRKGIANSRHCQALLRAASPNNRKKDARLLYVMELASSRFAAPWMASNIYSGKRRDF